ncbi:MAG: SDR family oxidoreductase [Paracoccus sp. (in: a-proteobacteria)]|nr:SDR family oxidoreductase [Paracoccus sp. (in: a-proteobacteria)]
MHMLIFGHGYCAAALTPQLISRGWSVSGTTRGDPARVTASGARAIEWTGDEAALLGEISRADAVLSCVAPVAVAAGTAPADERAAGNSNKPSFSPPVVRYDPADGDPADRQGAPSPTYFDPVLDRFGHALRQARPRWLGYVSSTSVYGDHGGGWVDETTPPHPGFPRAQARLEAEMAWAGLSAEAGWPLTIFRLAGIYGPGRGPFAKLRAGTARRIIRPGQIFSRIHVADVAGAILASLDRTPSGDNVSCCSEGSAGVPVGASIFNLCDDDPAPPENTIEVAAGMLGMPVPEAEAFETAQMSTMARSFYHDSKRVRNDRLKDLLGYRLLYPDLRSGLDDILRQEGEAQP